MNANLVLRNFLASIALVLGLGISCYATHLRAGEIIVERESCNSLTFRITVTVFTNTIDTNVLFGGEDDWLDFGDGVRIPVKPEIPNTLRPDLGPGIATASFTTLYTYSGFQEYTISYSEPNRNRGVVNMDGSVDTRFYIETKIIVDPFLGCNNTPKLLVPPIDRACTGVAWFHNPGAYDPDGDSLSYELVVPFREKETQVRNYKDPADPKFYNNFSTGNESANGPPSFRINATDGTITWDAPGSLMVGEYNIAFIIKEWRNIKGQWYMTGYVRRDMQIIVDDCQNKRPDLIVPEDVCVEAGSLLDATIFGIDPDNNSVKIEAFSEIFNLAAAQSPATYSPNPAVFQPSTPVPAELRFQWQTQCNHVKAQPYQVVFKITDNPPNGTKLVTFKTWFIRVVGPPPEWVSAQVAPALRAADLQWDSYVCQNASDMQVWRRVDSFAFEPDSCQTGMPEFLGYSLIATLPVKDANNNAVTTYRDNNKGRGLAAGAQYCYRLVAQFPTPRGGESYVSDEICIDPILADAPVITHVTIDKTSDKNGQVTVRWTKPFDLDRTQFSGALEYEVYRAEGFAGAANIRKAHPGRKTENDTTLIDAEETLNTRDITYNYRVVLYTAASPLPVDTSFTASTVRLEAQSEFKKISLNWSAFVPWSNLIQTVPNKHLLYRGPEGADESQLELIAEIDPTIAGFTYVDEGQHNGVPLVDTQEYCYRVLTRGAYGNPKIGEPLENFSQIICAKPNDSIPPCKPVLQVKLSDCEQFILQTPCNQTSFSNTLFWARPTSDCAEDVQGYKIYRAAQKDGEYVWLENAGVKGIVRDTFFIDNGIAGLGLTSLAYCYKISSIDRSNNESELSDPVCNDNCPYYELPNVFSPGNADPCNDTFGAYRRPEYYAKGEEGGLCGPVAPTKCARFVETVNFKVFNRWGKQVYSYRGANNDDQNDIYIDWDGRAEDGTDLATGVYYYVAEVRFVSVDPKKRNQIIKGWVHLIR